MADRTSEAVSPLAASAPTSATTTALPPPSPTATSAPHSRVSQLQSRPSRVARASPSPGPSGNSKPLRRRSSVLSLSSIEDATLSFTDEVINTRPRLGIASPNERQLTHWHSSPLAFAILPAIGGLLFHNGSAFVTDVLLLGLAAIFMNWSIRLPWDWYYSAQARQEDIESPVDSATIVEEDEDTAVDTTSSIGGESPRTSFVAAREAMAKPLDKQTVERETAAADLRRQEILALIATFLFPAAAAYLLHIIRAQLSGASTSLVSDYNLSIFLLGAEIQPCRQLARLVANRTLHLQRVVTGATDLVAATVQQEKEAISSLTSRLTELESRLADTTFVHGTVPVAHKTDVNELSTEMKRRYEPRLEALERAVRHYEKRSTTLTMVLDQRLASMETRLQDALSLAAVAAQHSRSRGSVSTLVESISAAVAWPFRIGVSACLVPFRMLEELYTRFKNMVLGPIPSRPAKRRATRPEGVHDERLREKSTKKSGLRERT